MTFEIEGLGVVEVTGQTVEQEKPRVVVYEVKLNGVPGRLAISERPSGATRTPPTGQGWRPWGDPTISVEAQDAIAAEIIKREWPR